MIRTPMPDLENCPVGKIWRILTSHKIDFQTENLPLLIVQKVLKILNMRHQIDWFLCIDLISYPALAFYSRLRHERSTRHCFLFTFLLSRQCSVQHLDKMTTLSSHSGMNICLRALQMIVQIIPEAQAKLYSVHLFGFARNHLLTKRYHDISSSRVVVISEYVSNFSRGFSDESSDTGSCYPGLRELLDENFSYFEIVVIIELGSVCQFNLVG